jgi:lipase chaperone LimK
MFGDEAVQRFDALDRQRAQWKARINTYLSQRADILNSQGLVADELSTQVDALRASLFDEREQIRVRSIERHGEG